MASQASKYARILLPLAMAWISLIFDLIPGWKLETDSIRRSILLAPILALFAFGVYCLAMLYTQVVRFQDRPDEAESLKKEIQEAKADLRRKGMKIEEKTF